MKTSGFVLFEYDENEEILISFIFPQASPQLKTVVQETAGILVASNVYSLFSSYKDDFLYFEGMPAPDKSTGVRLYGICVLAPKCHPPLYSSYAKILCEMYANHANPPKVLRAYLSSQTDGQVSYQGDEFSADEFEADPFRQAKYDILLDRAAQHIPMIWQALVTGKTVAVYAPDILVLQSCAIPILSFVLPGTRNLLPLVIESSTTQSEAADATRHPIWCSMDAAVLNNRFDLVVDLSSRNLRCSQAFSKEAGTSALLGQLHEAVVNATANDANLVDVFEQFNGQILKMLSTIKDRLGELTPKTIATVKLPSDTKFILAAIAASGVFTI
jgi:hypothetical protein